MRALVVWLIALTGYAAVAAAQTAVPVPPGANPDTGARPGNDIGTGMSLPTSDKAGNIVPEDTTSTIAGRLPPPPVDDNASVHTLLLAARSALVGDRTGEAQEALERAETRALDRSVPLFQTSTAIKDPLVTHIQEVLHTLGGGDRLEAMRLLERAITETAAAQQDPASKN